MVRLVYGSTIKNTGQIVNKIGKYLSQNLDGAYKIAFHPMECEVFLKMFYEIAGDRESFREIHFIISVTSYSNKLRLNLTEQTPAENTIGQLIISPEDLEAHNMSALKYRVRDWLDKSIRKAYKDYEFVY